MIDQRLLAISPKHAELLEEKRKISLDTCVRLGIVTHPDGTKIGFQTWDVSETERTELAYTKWRSPGKDFRIEPAGQRLRLWNLPPISALNSFEGGTLTITEGEFDAASFEEVGILATSVPNGAAGARPRSDDQDDETQEIDPRDDRGFSYLWSDAGKLIPQLALAQKIIVATDADGPGDMLRDDLSIRLGADRIWYVSYPPGCKDANDVLVKFGSEALRDVFKNAYPLIPSHLTRPSDVTPMKRRGPYHSGWREMDNHLLAWAPELVIVTGVPGAGKTQWTQNWVCNMARLSGERAALIGFEDGIERVKEDLSAYEERCKKLTVRPTYDGWADDHILIKGPSIAEDDEPEEDLKWLEQTIWEAACRHDCRFIVIDPWNEVSHMFGPGMREDQYLNSALRRIKQLGRRYSVMIIIVVHPDKFGGRNETIETMTMYSISGGATWKNKADGGIIVGRELKLDEATGKEVATGRTIVKIDKRKDWRTMGTPGEVSFRFDPTCRIFEDCRPHRF